MSKNKSIRVRLKSPYFTGVLLILYTLIFYLFSLCPTVYLIDSGELAAVSYTLGIAHPTGYPLYTLISYFFAHLPGEPVFNLNILSALFTAAAVFLTYLFSRSVIKKSPISIIPAILLAFAPTIWRTSITNEVYPLTVLFASAILFLLFKIRDERDFYILMYVIGLAFTNHVIIFTVAVPAVLYAAVVYRSSAKQFIVGLLFALLGGSLYLYLIIRTLGGAELHWGDTYNLQRLLWHITGKQYRVWMFSLPLSEIFINLQKGILILIRDFLYIFLIPIFVGFYVLFKNERKKFWFFSAVIVFNFLYAVNYSIPDIESYYIPALVSFISVLGFGLTRLKKILPWFVTIPLALAIPFLNYNSCTLRNNTFAYDLSYAHIRELPKNSLVLSTLWDIYSPLLYLQKVKGIRKDLVLIDKELLRRTWYIRFLKNEYPEFYKKVENSINSYLVELYKFEYDKPYSPALIQMRFINLLESFIEAKIDEHVYLIMPFPDRDLNQTKIDYHWIPRGLVFEIKKEPACDTHFDFSKLALEKPAVVNDERLNHMINIVERMAYYNITYLKTQKRFTEAAEIKNWLENSFPSQ